MKTLILYYSYGGNTKKVAEMIQKEIGGDMEEIHTVKPYIGSYNSVVEQGKREVDSGFMPEIKAIQSDLSNYDKVILGTPVWWYTMASPVKTFLSENDFSGKIIVPFCTHGGGGASATYSDMQKLAKGAVVKEGYTSYENSAKESEIRAWINKLDF